MVPRKRLELLHLAATASKTVMSTIPSPGQICLDLQLFVMYPIHVSHRFTDARIQEYGSLRSRIYYSITWANMSGARDGTWTHTPEGIRIWNVRVYHSTTRAYYSDLWAKYVYPSRLRLGGMALEYSLNAHFEPHIYHSTTRAYYSDLWAKYVYPSWLYLEWTSEGSIEKMKRKANFWIKNSS